MLEFDLPEAIKASMMTKCDACMATLGESYAKGRHNISLGLHTGTDEHGYDQFKQHHFCNEACLRAFLNKRADDTESLASEDKKKVVEAADKKQTDHKSEYGDVEYADPKNHKYPINSEERVRGAWSYINMPKNQKGYSPEEVARIKSKIRSKFKQYGIEENKDK